MFLERYLSIVVYSCHDTVLYIVKLNIIHITVDMSGLKVKSTKQVILFDYFYVQSTMGAALRSVDAVLALAGVVIFHTTHVFSILF